MEPGKIPHEIRHGELAQLGILPFQPYYGTHDATSLFVIVLSYLYHWLGDDGLLRRYLAERRGGDALDRPLRRPRRRRVPGVRDALVARLLQPGLEGRRRRDPARRRHARPAARSRCASSRATSTTPSSGWPTIYDAPRTGRRTPRACAREAAEPVRPLQRRRSGGRRRGPTTSGSTARSGRSGPWPRTPATSSSRGSCRPSGPARVVERLHARTTCGRAGGSGRCRRTMWRTTRSATTRGRSGRTTTRSSPAGSGATASPRRRRRSRKGLFDAAERLGAVPPARAVRRPAPARGVVPGPVPRARTSPRRGPRARSSGSSRSSRGIHARTDRDRDRGSTSTRRCRTGCPSSRSRNLRAGHGAVSISLVDGTLDVTSNTTGFEVRHGAPPRVTGRPAVGG